MAEKKNWDHIHSENTQKHDSVNLAVLWKTDQIF